MPTQRFSPNKNEAIGKILDGEAIIINLVSGAYYSTAGVGATIWQAIENGRTVPQIVAIVAAEYEVDENAARLDVVRFLDEMKRENLVLAEEVDETDVDGTDRVQANPNASAPSRAARAPYQPPELSVYRDMSDLLALDPPMPVFGNTPKDWDGKPPR